MAKPRREDPLLERASALRSDAAGYGGTASRRLRDLTDVERRLAPMRGQVNSTVNNALAGPATDQNTALAKALARGKTISQATLQGDKQLRMANLMTRAKTSTSLLQGELGLDQLLGNQIQREADFHSAKKRGKAMVRGAKLGLAGSIIGAGAGAFMNRAPGQTEIQKGLANNTLMDSPMNGIDFNPASADGFFKPQGPRYT